MTFREKLADWISGGKLSAVNVSLRASVRFMAEYEDALHRIKLQETPKANATVKRMASIAREALGE